MPPEMLDGELVGKYCDYYSFGIVIYELMTGIPPFIGPDIEDVYNRIRQGSIRFPGYLSENSIDLIRVNFVLLYFEEIYCQDAKAEDEFY
jgi:serine/threonine protein kinase